MFYCINGSILHFLENEQEQNHLQITVESSCQAVSVATKGVADYLVLQMNIHIVQPGYIAEVFRKMGSKQKDLSRRDRYEEVSK